MKRALQLARRRAKRKADKKVRVAIAEKRLQDAMEMYSMMAFDRHVYRPTAELFDKVLKQERENYRKALAS